MPLLAAAAVFASVLLLVLALGGSEASVRSRLQALQGRPRDSGQGGQLSVKERLVAPMGETVVQGIRRLMPAAMLERVQHRLVLAGDPMTVNAFLTLQVVVTGAFLFLPLLVIVGAGLAFRPLFLLMIAGFGFLGFFLCQTWLQQRSEARRAQVVKSLPDSFDLITTCVEAGLGLDASLARVAEKVEGPFADELRRMLREVALGKLRRDALRELAERTDVPDLVSFVNAVIQAEQMGSSIGTVLRVQAEQLRIRRRQRAEAQAQKAPVKMVFPLVLCIFPSLFIVILGPAVITIMREFPV